jgi:CTP:molybdopterin cytidylyltransferase MocA
VSAPIHAAIVLAAGGSRRLGRPKQLLEIDGVPLLRRAVETALATGPVHAVVVLGAESQRMRAALADLRVEAVECPDWAEGMGASLRAGITRMPVGADGALVVLCDQPALDSAHLASLVASWRESPACAVASRYAGVRGVPALLPRAWFGELAAARGDAGARELLRGRANVREVVNEALARDIDLPGDVPPRA